MPSIGPHQDIDPTPAAEVVIGGIAQSQVAASEAMVATQIAINNILNVLSGLNQQLDLEISWATLPTVDAYEMPDRPDLDPQFPDAPDLSPATMGAIRPGSLLAIDPNFQTAPTNPNIQFNAPTEPTFLDPLLHFPDAPPDASYGHVNELTIGDEPQLTATEPVIREITAPAPFAEAAPDTPALVERAYPDAPSDALPAPITLRDLTLPEAPTPLSFDFEGAIPAVLDAAPNTDFTFSEAEYQSALSTQLKTSLLDLVLNVRQTGLSAAVEQQIWDRARERTAAVTRDVIENIQRMYQRAGHELPAGDEVESVFKAQEDAAAQDITESRNIAIAQAELEQKNFQFAFTQAIALEGQLIGLHNNVQQRALDAAKYAVEAAISIFQAKVAYFNANVQLYVAQAQVYRDKIQAELSKIEIYKAQLEGQKLISELNAQDIANYKAQIDAVVALYELYKSKLLAVKTQLEGDSLRIQQFEAQIRAFAEKIRAKSLEYEGYKAELSGEEIKANIFGSIVNAFQARTQAFVAATDAKVKKQDADIKIAYDVPLAKLKQETDVFVAKINATSEQSKAINAINEILQKLYETRAAVEETRIKAETDIYKTEVEALKNANDAEASRLGAYNDANRVTAEIYKADSEVEANRLRAITDNNLALVESYKAGIQGKSAEITGTTEIYRVNADVQAKRVESQIAIQKQSLDRQVAEVNAMIESAKTRVAQFLGLKDLIISALKTIAQVQAQLAASFGSAVNYSAGVSTNVGVSDSHSISHIQSESISSGS